MNNVKLTLSLLAFLSAATSSVIYSSFSSWGVTSIEADGMQLFVVVFIICPVHLLIAILGFVRKAKTLSLLSCIAGVSIAVPVIDRTVTPISATAGFVISFTFAVLFAVVVVRESARTKYA